MNDELYQMTLARMEPHEIEAIAWILGQFAAKADVPKKVGRDIMHELLDQYMPNKPKGESS